MICAIYARKNTDQVGSGQLEAMDRGREPVGG
jgi:hypothetical protein